jgi:integration host factor subunit alpha
MTKADIVEKIQNATGLTKKDAAEMMEAVFSVMKSTLESGENLKIAGFGNFEVKQKNDRRGRNPHTGEAITIAARQVLTFKPSALLKKAINK